MAYFRNKALRKETVLPIELHGLHVGEAIDNLRKVLAGLQGTTLRRAPLVLVLHAPRCECIRCLTTSASAPSDTPCL